MEKGTKAWVSVSGENSGFLRIVIIKEYFVKEKALLSFFESSLLFCLLMGIFLIGVLCDRIYCRYPWRCLKGKRR